MNEGQQVAAEPSGGSDETKEEAFRYGETGNPRADELLRPCSQTSATPMEPLAVVDGEGPDGAMPSLYRVEYVIFSGGSVKGLSFVGALGALQRLWALRGLNFLAEMKGFGGSSIGALLAMLCACGLSPQEMEHEILYGQDFAALVGDMNITDLYMRYGLSTRDGLERWVRALLARRFPLSGGALITFRQMHQETGKILRVTASNVSRGQLVVFDHETHPDLSVALAVVTSMAIPILFVPTIVGEEYHVDGGLYSNFPFGLFNPTRTLGLRLRAGLPDRIRCLSDYIGRVIFSSLCMSEEVAVRRWINVHRDRIVDITVEGVSPLDFDLSFHRRKEVIESGARAVREHLRRSRFVLQSIRWILGVAYARASGGSGNCSA